MVNVIFSVPIQIIMWLSIIGKNNSYIKNLRGTFFMCNIRVMSDHDSRLMSHE